MTTTTSKAVAENTNKTKAKSTPATTTNNTKANATAATTAKTDSAAVSMSEKVPEQNMISTLAVAVSGGAAGIPQSY